MSARYVHQNGTWPVRAARPEVKRQAERIAARALCYVEGGWSRIREVD